MEKKSMQHLVMGLVIGLLVAGAAFMLFVSMNASDGDYLGFVRGQKVKNKTVNQTQGLQTEVKFLQKSLFREAVLRLSNNFNDDNDGQTLFEECIDDCLENGYYYLDGAGGAIESNPTLEQCTNHCEDLLEYGKGEDMPLVGDADECDNGAWSHCDDSGCNCYECADPDNTWAISDDCD